MTPGLLVLQQLVSIEASSPQITVGCSEIRRDWYDLNEDLRY